MKKTLFATLFCLLLCGSLFAQSQQVNLRGGKVTLGQLFKEIESQTEMSVDYDAQEIDLAQTVTVPAGTSTVKAVLDASLESVGYTGTINKSHIIVKVKEVSSKQGHVVKGTVIDMTGEPVAGVGIFVKGTSNGTTTDIDGN